MHKTIRNRWIQTGTALVVLAALTAGTRQPVTPPPGEVPADLPHTAVSNAVAPGMVAVQMHDLKQNQLTGIRERIALPDQDGLLGQFGSSPNPVGGAMPPMSMPAMQQPHPAELDRRLQFGGDIGEAPNEASGLSWGWLADDVNSAEPPATREPESGGFGFAPSSGARLYEDRDNRLGTDRGFGSGGNDAFIFQRRRDERFSE